MEFNFNYSGPMDEDFWMIFAAIYGVVLLIGLLTALAVYLVRAFALYTIAKRRALDKAWLVWVPVAESWIIGSLSDQYQYLVRGENKVKRKLLLGLAAGSSALSVSTMVVAVVMAVTLAISGAGMSHGQMASSMMTPVIAVLVLSGILGVIKIVEYVLRQVCMYDLYRSCDPGNSVAYLVLGILFSVLEPIFLIALRKKDDGLPPRREIQ